jgi:formylglycine-generating enzyme required for sulfatase activity
LQRISLPSRDDEEWEIKRQTRQGKQLIEQLSEEIALEMVLIPPGEFMMGSLRNERDKSSSEKPQHKVKLEKAFLMGKYPVTQEQWRAVAGFPHVNRELKPNPSRFKGIGLVSEKTKKRLKREQSSILNQDKFYSSARELFEGIVNWLDSDSICGLEHGEIESKLFENG